MTVFVTASTVYNFLYIILIVRMVLGHYFLLQKWLILLFIDIIIIIIITQWNYQNRASAGYEFCGIELENIFFYIWRALQTCFIWRIPKYFLTYFQKLKFFVNGTDNPQKWHDTKLTLSHLICGIFISKIATNGTKVLIALARVRIWLINAKEECSRIVCKCVPCYATYQDLCLK